MQFIKVCNGWIQLFAFGGGIVQFTHVSIAYMRDCP